MYFRCAWSKFSAKISNFLWWVGYVITPTPVATPQPTPPTTLWQRLEWQQPVSKWQQHYDWLCDCNRGKVLLLLTRGPPLSNKLILSILDSPTDCIDTWNSTGSSSLPSTRSRIIIYDADQMPMAGQPWCLISDLADAEIGTVSPLTFILEPEDCWAALTVMGPWPYELHHWQRGI